jgi:hypothetical protein
VLTEPTVAAEAGGRGGDKAVADLTARAAAVRAAAEGLSAPRGTPQETEKLDLLDGIIVELARAASEAAKAASKELGEPAMATAFELRELYGAKRSRAGGAGEEGDAEAGSQEGVTAEGSGQEAAAGDGGASPAKPAESQGTGGAGTG